MKSLRQVVSVILVVCVLSSVTSVLPVSSSAAVKSVAKSAEENPGCESEKREISCTFDEDTGTLTVSGDGEIYNMNYRDSPWSPYISSTKALVIESGITAIGTYSFEYSNITSVALPEGLKRIDDYGGCEETDF